MEAEHDVPRFEIATPQHRRITATTVLWVLASIGVIAALGYHAFQLSAERDALRAELGNSVREVGRLRSLEQAKTLQVDTLRGERDEAATLLTQTNAKLVDVNTELAAAQTRLDELDEQRSEIADQLSEFKQMTAQLKRMIDSGRLQVTFRRGRMIVELPAQVLFPSGSADLTKEGRDALDEVAKILRSFKNRRFIVAGHTDNVPVAGRFASNWELSSARAVNVTSELIRGGLRPEQLVAAGYSEYDPVARNTNEKGKQKNRRIEIILEPKLRPIPGFEAKASK